MVNIESIKQSMEAAGIPVTLEVVKYLEDLKKSGASARVVVLNPSDESILEEKLSSAGVNGTEEIVRAMREALAKGRAVLCIDESVRV